jgi:hypothetical protein
MKRVATHHEWLVKKDILRLLGSHPMPFPVLVNIGVIPVKPSATLQRILCRHDFSI